MSKARVILPTLNHSGVHSIFYQAEEEKAIMLKKKGKETKKVEKRKQFNLLYLEVKMT